MRQNKYQATILEDIPCLSISTLKKGFNLNWIGTKSKTLNLLYANKATGEMECRGHIQATVTIDDGNDHLLPQYEVNGHEVNDRIDLNCIKSSLGKGYLYYFLCPVTAKPVRKIYLHDGHFISRHAIDNYHYRSQTESKRKREALWWDRKAMKSWNIILSSHKPYFKATYGGRLTLSAKKVKAAISVYKRYRQGVINSMYQEIDQT